MRAIDADKLLQYWGPPGAGGPEFSQGDICDSINAQPTLDVIPARWISVKERLPPDLPLGWYVRAITYNGKHVRYMCYEHAIVRGKEVYRWKYPSGETYNGPAITHWMPLPGAPADAERS